MPALLRLNEYVFRSSQGPRTLQFMREYMPQIHLCGTHNVHNNNKLTLITQYVKNQVIRKPGKGIRNANVYQMRILNPMKSPLTCVSKENM